MYNCSQGVSMLGLLGGSSRVMIFSFGSIRVDYSENIGKKLTAGYCS